VLLRPEDVVGEEPVAVERGLFGDLGRADAAVPHERRNVVERPRRRGESLKRGAERALPIDDVFAPQAVQQVVVLQCHRQALPDVLPEPRVDRGRVAAPEHEVHAAAREVLQHRVVLGDLHRVVRRDECRRGRHDEALGQRRDVREQGRGGGGEERRVVVLADGEDVHSDLFGLLRDRDGCLDAVGLAGRLARDRVARDVADRENSELHGDHS
jgi:hypothetical protein